MSETIRGELQALSAAPRYETLRVIVERLEAFSLRNEFLDESVQALLGMARLCLSPNQYSAAIVETLRKAVLTGLGKGCEWILTSVLALSLIHI